MKNLSNEVKISIILGAIALTGCLIAFIINYRNLHPKDGTIDIKVSKHFWIDEDAGEGTYVECSLNDKELAKVNLEVKKVSNLKSKDKVTDSATIMKGLIGEYKVDIGESKSNYIAFDASGGLVYRSSDGGLYYYRSDLYKDVESYCAGVTRDNIVPNNP